ncbi:hypothetical protein [Pseudomonas serbica]|uniref:hypothetical protein n=1 Tax=Pseudomonas serbica TaxID=2965074 RepID=UPI00237AC8A4|nr:hypothetical protein [Pseudomonas serbica]
MNSSHCTVVGTIIRDLEDNLEKITHSRNHAPKFFDKLETDIPKLANSLKDLDVQSKRGKIQLLRAQDVIGKIIERHTYFVVDAGLLEVCQSINPNPFLLTSLIAAGLSYLISNPEEPKRTKLAVVCAKAGGLVQSDHGLGNLRRDLSKGPEGAVSYTAKSKQQLGRAHLATELVASLFVAQVEYDDLVDPRDAGLLLQDYLAALIVCGGREGTLKALALIDEHIDLLSARLDLRKTSSLDHLPQNEHHKNRLMRNIFTETNSSNLLMGLREAYPERYQSFIDDEHVMFMVFMMIRGDNEKFDFSSLSGFADGPKQSLLTSVMTRFNAETKLDSKLATQYLGVLKRNGFTQKQVIDQLNAEGNLFGHLRQVMKSVPEEVTWTHDEAVELLSEMSIGRNAVSMAVLLKQGDITSSLKSNPEIRSFVSALALELHNEDIYETLDMRRSHMGLLELVAYSNTATESEEYVEPLKRDFMASLVDTRTQNALLKIHDQTLNVYKGHFPQVFTDEFMRSLQWKSPHVLKHIFSEDLGL